VRTAGVREARQNLSALLDEVRKGREVLITERGRRKMPILDPPLSTTVDEDRADRL
jgi:prevent-host-death family protein